MSTRDYRTNNRITEDSSTPRSSIQRDSASRRTSTRTASDRESTARRRDARVTGGPSPREGSRSSYGSRNVYVGQEPTVIERATNMLPDNVWVNRAILLAIILILIFILFNLVTCIGGAITGQSSQTSSNDAAATQASAGAENATASGEGQNNNGGGQGVESPWTDDGRFSTGDSALDNYIKQLCDEHSTAGASFDKNAYDAYIYVSRTDYVERKNNQSPWGPTWDVEYAKQYFDEGNKGNCYNFCAVYEYILKYFGYSDAEAEPCVVKLDSGSWGDHGLVFVTNKVDGKRCLVDGALSANGWMLDINAYDYDVRNINQNSSIKGNVDAIDDDNNPTPIPPGELTEGESDSSSSSSSASASSDSENEDSESTSNTDEGSEDTESNEDSENGDEESTDEETDSESDEEYTEEEE